MAELRPELLTPDVVETPAWLHRAAIAHAGVDPLALEARRVLFIGMGSSRYAALNAAAYLRSLGRDAYAEHASTGAPQPPEEGLLVVAISAGGGSRETIAAARRHRGTSTVVGITNRPQSALASEVDTCLELHAGEEVSGVACRTYTNTLALLLMMSGIEARRVAAAADASAGLINTTGEWLGAAAELVGRRAIHVLAPAERIGSAEQSALMLREVPRIRADACETGDWSHVDVYLAKSLDYRAILFLGSRWDGQAVEWLTKRGATFVAVGGDIPGARAAIRYAGDEDPDIARHTEVLVPELLAATWWRLQV